MYKILLIVVVALLFTILWKVGQRHLLYESENLLRQGVSDLKKGDYSLAMKKIKPFAERNNPHARRVIGQMYAFGLGVPVDDVLAEQWFSCNGVAGCIDGENEFDAAMEYIQGHMTKKDSTKAKYWLGIAKAKSYTYPTTKEIQNLVENLK